LVKCRGGAFQHAVELTFQADLPVENIHTTFKFLTTKTTTNEEQNIHIRSTLTDFSFQ
jgi:hypothetical protein